MRRERDFAIVFELQGVAPAVSPDGKRIAYWRNAPNAGGIVSGTDLRVLEVANPTGDRSVFIPAAEMLGAGVVWSNDGQGLFIETYSRARRASPGPESCPLQTELLMVDLAATPVTTRSAGSGGCGLRPLAWDRPGQVAAAVVTGSGGYTTEYVTWNGNAASPFARTPIPEESGEARTGSLLIAGWIEASPDAKFLMGLQSNRNVLRVWPILDITKAEQVRATSDITSNPVWRAGPTAPYEVIWGMGQSVRHLQVPNGSSTTLYTSTQNVGIAAVRPDGSAALLVESPCCLPPPPTTRLFVVDVATRQVTDVGTQLGGVGLPSHGVLLR